MSVVNSGEPIGGEIGSPRTNGVFFLPKDANEEKDERDEPRDGEPCRLSGGGFWPRLVDDLGEVGDLSMSSSGGGDGKRPES